MILSHSPAWIQKKLDDFKTFCDTKGFIINPQKCQVMMSTTLKFYRENSSPKPTFRINGKPISYIASAKYLGFTISSSLSDAAHTREIFSKFSKAVAIFKSSVKISKKCLLLRFARTYLLPTLHNLEFVNKVTKAQHGRFLYNLRKIFNLKSEQDLENFRGGFRWLFLENMLEDARKRYDQIDT